MVNAGIHLSWLMVHSPFMDYTGIYLSWLRVHSPIMAYAAWHSPVLAYTLEFMAEGAFTRPWQTLAFIFHGFCCHSPALAYDNSPVMAEGTLTCHGGQWHTPVIAYAGIHLSLLTLEFTCHGKECTHLSRRTMAFTCHGWWCNHLSWLPHSPVLAYTLKFMAEGALTCNGVHCHSPVIAEGALTCPGLYAGIHGLGCIHRSWKSLAFTCHGWLCPSPSSSWMCRQGWGHSL